MFNESKHGDMDNDNHTITVGFGKLLEQAADTPEAYFIAGIQNIDKVFGEGYAKEHPELIGAYIKAAAMDYHAMAIGKILQDNLTELQETVKNLSNAIGELIEGR